jgi:hypothetical protein
MSLPRIETGDVSTKHANNTDRLFVRQAAIGGNAETELSEAAQTNAQAEETRDFAQQRRRRSDDGFEIDRSPRIRRE